MPKNTFLSAGVYTREFDQSFLPGTPSGVGAAIIGPTVRGPAMVPTTISEYSDYLRWFGDVFASGSGASEQEYKYLTTYAVQEYLRWGETATVVRILAGSYTAAYSNVLSRQGAVSPNDYSPSFRLISLSDGELVNSGRQTAAISGSGVAADELTGGNGSLISGSRYNIRWEVANVDTDRGTFDVYIRRGDDIDTRKVVLEQFIGVSLDPNTSNYITKVIGDSSYTIRYDSSGDPYLQLSGSYSNRSRFVRVQVFKNTLNYLTNEGNIRDQSMTGSLPNGFSGSLNASGTYTEVILPMSGTFAYGSDGTVAHPRAMYENIWNLNTQGFNLSSGNAAETAYNDAIDILSNKDQYDFDLLLTPGLIDNLEDHSRMITRAITMVEERGDAFYIVDPTYFGSTVGQARAAAEGRNSNYAGYYYPWVSIVDPDLGANKWVPPSAILPSVISFNDYVGEKWFAPAGLNRGGVDMGIKTERIMTQNDRDNLYIKNVNPLASFPKTGIAVWGQKTLQKKQSALDRINVRRLLIAAKRHVAETSKWIVFENNTAETRMRFMNITRPWFENCRRKQGLYDFRIIMDERNNTPDVVDRNEMRAQIYLKPAKTAEYLIVDFIIMPTGAAFPVDELASST